MLLVAGLASAQYNAVFPAEGEATLTVPADMTLITVSVESSNNNSTIASMENQEKLDKIISDLTAIGVNKGDISSGQSTNERSFQMSGTVCTPVNNSTVCKSESVTDYGLTSSKIIKLNSTDDSFVNKVISTAKSGGASTDSSYYLSDSSSAIADARNKATENARSNAEMMASAAGAKLGKVLNINSYPEYISGSDQTGMVKVTSYVVVTYELIS